MKKFIKRLCIIFLWILVISAALYFPSWKIISPKEKSINLFSWGNILLPEVIADFEHETGIKVYLSAYASNEELQVKMEATKGIGYDLIMPSDYAVAVLTKKDLLKPLDHSKIQFWKELDPSLLNRYFDPGNRYSIPFEWEIYGLGVDRSFFKETSFIPSWKSIYDQNVIDYRIAVQNDPIEAVALASLYLFNEVKDLSPQKFAEVKNLLLQQRVWVEAYSDARAPYFIATGNCPVALTTSSYIRGVCMLCPDVDFVIPEEGSFISIENFCIPKASNKQEYVYRFLNHLYKEKLIKAHFEKFGLYPAFKISYEDLTLLPHEKKLLEITPEEFQKLHLFKRIIPQQQVRDLWVEVKSF